MKAESLPGEDAGQLPLDGTVALVSGGSRGHLCVSQNLEVLLARIDEIERDDLHTLRLRTGI